VATAQTQYLAPHPAWYRLGGQVVTHLNDQNSQSRKSLQEDLVDIAHRLLPLINVKGIDTNRRWSKKKKSQQPATDQQALATPV